jgi:AcrR family transcriptional regulator
LFDMSIATRRREEKEQRRAEILDAAEAVFAAGAVDHATMEDVARHARLSRSLIYFYFKDKEDLYDAVTLRGLQQLRRQLVAAGRSPTRGMDRILALVRAYARFARARPDYFEAIARLAARVPATGQQGRHRQACVAQGERILRAVAATIHGGIKDGSIRADARHPFAVAVALWGVAHGLMQLLARRDDRPVYGVAVEHLLEEALDLVRNGMAAGST